MHCKILNPDGTAGVTTCLSLLLLPPYLLGARGPDNRCPFCQPTAGTQEHLDPEQRLATLQSHRKEKERQPQFRLEKKIFHKQRPFGEPSL